MSYIDWGNQDSEQARKRKLKEEEENLRFIQSVKLARAISAAATAGAVGSNNPVLPTFVHKETPAGLVDGLNRIFALHYEPDTRSEHLYLNGLLQDSDPDADYQINKNIIIFNEAPPVWSRIKCTYLVKTTK